MSVPVCVYGTARIFKNRKKKNIDNTLNYVKSVINKVDKKDIELVEGIIDYLKSMIQKE